MELKASSRQLAGGAHWTFHVGGAECLCQPSGLHKPCGASSPRVLPSASGRELVARDPGETRTQELAARCPLLWGNSSARELQVSGRLPCLEYRLCWVRRGIGCLVGQHCPIPSAEEMKGVEIKYSAHSRFMEWRKEKEVREACQDSSPAAA